MAEPHCDAARFHGLFDALAQIGRTPEGGVHRLAASPADKAARDWLGGVFETLGLRSIVDPVGNMAGVLDLAGPDAPLVMSGSHLDSQPQGGRFDGALGVVAACEAAFVLRAAAAAGTLRPRANFAVVNWTNEEGARFQPSLLGSATFTGSIGRDAALALTDQSGTSLGAALHAIGYAGAGAIPRPAAYVELHVECGPVLENSAQAVGVFTHYWGTVKRRVAFTGAQSHTGPTPMAVRRDALLGAAHLITALRDMADRAPAPCTPPPAVSTSPRTRRTSFRRRLCCSWNFARRRRRPWSGRRRNSSATPFRPHRAPASAWNGGGSSAVPPGGSDPALTACCQAASLAPGRPLATVPGHDAISLGCDLPRRHAGRAERWGLCHHPDEFTAAADLLRGAEALTRVLWRLCEQGGTP